MAGIMELSRNWHTEWVKHTIEDMDNRQREGENEITLNVREFQHILTQLLAAQQRSDRLEDVLCSYARYAFPYGGMDYPVFYMDEAKNIPPAMFGGICSTDRTASGATVGPPVGSAPGDRNPEDKLKCICAAKNEVHGTVAHSQTCKDYNWKYWHPTKPMTEHVYGEWRKSLGGSDWRICVRCHMSSTYIEVYDIATCTGKYVPPKS